VRKRERASEIAKKIQW